MFQIVGSGLLKDHRESEDDYDMCQPKTMVYVLETEAPTLSDDDMQYVYDYFRLRCFCAHDCCGHRNGGVDTVNKMYDNQYIVTVTSALNY
jgi:hypothetical protein